MSIVEVLPKSSGIPYERTEKGKIYRVVSGAPQDQIVLRTDDPKHPFVNLDNGELWGSSLSSYEFELITSPIKITP